MNSTDSYIDPEMVKSLIKEELEIRRQRGIVSKPLIVFTDKDKLLKEDKKKTNQYNNKNKGRNIAPVLDPFHDFKLKEAAAIRKLETDDGITRRNALIETNKLLTGLPKFEPSKTQIYPMSPEEIRNLSIIPIISPNKESNMNGGLFDKRMGSIIRREICVTCGRDDQGCGGHLAHIDLPQPMVNPIFEKEAIWTAQCTCSYCGDTFIDEKFFYALGLNKIPQKNLLKVVADYTNKWLWELHDHKLEKTVYENDFRGPKLCYTIGTAEKSSKYIRSKLPEGSTFVKSALIFFIVKFLQIFTNTFHGDE